MSATLSKLAIPVRSVQKRYSSGTPEGLETYVIKGGRSGAARLSVLASALESSTQALLDRFGNLKDRMIIDAACGSGEVSIALANRTGPNGRVIGLDLDGEKLRIAAERAHSLGLDHCSFRSANLLKPWPIQGVDMIYARFILTHLPHPEEFLFHAWNALLPGGLLVVEDIDVEGKFCYPHSEAFERFQELYVLVTQHRGCDPFIGRRLETLLKDSGFSKTRTYAVRAFEHGNNNDAKRVLVMTFEAIIDSILAAQLATQQELKQLHSDLIAYAARDDTLISMPTVFQSWGYKNRDLDHSTA